MKIITNFDLPIKASVVTIGMFDGVHLGHSKVIQCFQGYAKKTDLEPVFLTFNPHPLEIVHPERAPLRLTTEHERLCLFENLGIKTVVRIPFSLDLSRKSPESFLEDNLIGSLHCKALIVGYDHGFGRERKGGVDFLRKMAERFGFDLQIVPPFVVDNVTVSSTKIRKSLATGDVSLAAKMLGRPYEISGIVVTGQGRGRKLGFPTANVSVEDQKKLIPADGVYAVRILSEGKQYDGMLNIGFRPTFGGTLRTVEVHILNFSSYLLGKHVTIRFEQRIRDEKKFVGVAELQKQLQDDREATTRILT